MTYTMDNIGEILPNATPAAIRAAVATQGLPGHRIGRQWYFDGDAVKAWLKS